MTITPMPTQTAWQSVPLDKLYDETTEARLKLEFAAALLRNPHNPFEAAREIEPSNDGRANWIATKWINDPIVVTALGDRVSEIGVAKAGLPSRDDLAVKMYREAEMVQDKNTKLSYYKAVADVLGYTSRGGANVNINTNPVTRPKIQRVPVFATDEDWERKARLIEARVKDTAG